MKNKTKRIMKRIGMIVAIVILGGLVGSFALIAANGFNRDVNPNNRITVGYVIEDNDTNGRGIDVSVDDDGVIRLNGKATSDDEFSVCFLTLEPGVYTISGLKSELDGVSLKAVYDGNKSAVSGLKNDTFVIENLSSVEIVISVKEGTWCWNKTIRPVLVEGDEPGEWWA